MRPVRSGPQAAILLVAGLLACSQGDEQARDEVAAPVLEGQLRFDVEYATFFGGSEDESVRNIRVYPDGSVLVGLGTWSDDLPTSEGAFQSRYHGEAADVGHWGSFGGDNFLLKLSPDGSSLQAATYLGGTKQERDVYGMALDPEGNVVVTSTTRSPDLPTTAGAFQASYAGGASDVYVAKLSADLRSLVWCTYLGGDGADSSPGGLDIGPSGEVSVVSLTNSSDFPTTAGAFRSESPTGIDAAVTRFSGDGQLLWSARLGGDGADAAVGVRESASGGVVVFGNSASPDFAGGTSLVPVENAVGADLFVAELDKANGGLVWATLLGGSGVDLAEHNLAFDARGNLLLSGVTESGDYPTTANSFQPELAGGSDGFVTALSPDGTRIVWSTLLGGAADDGLLVPTVGPDAAIFVIGSTSSVDFPVTRGALQTRYGGGPLDGILAVFSADGSQLLYSSYLGGKGRDLIRGVAVGNDGDVYLLGMTSSRAFPATRRAFQRKLAGREDAFIVKLRPRQR